MGTLGPSIQDCIDAKCGRGHGVMALLIQALHILQQGLGLPGGCSLGIIFGATTAATPGGHGHNVSNLIGLYFIATLLNAFEEPLRFPPFAATGERLEDAIVGHDVGCAVHLAGAVFF